MNFSLSRRRVFLYVALAAAVNFIGLNLLTDWSPEDVGNAVFNALRIVIAFAGGWLLVAAAGAPLRVAALAGIVVLAVDHLLLKGGWFLADEFFSPSTGAREGYLAFDGVLISFVFFVPVAALCSWLGGLAARLAR
jgi:hypothetical protein